MLKGDNSLNKQKDSPYELLRTKEIIAILDGDTKYGKYEFNDGTELQIMMPYLSGPDLCGVSTLFGLPATYSWGGVNLSRWQYLDNLMIHCIEENRCSDLLAYLFDKKQFSKMLSGHEVDDINAAYDHITKSIIQEINGVLFFGGNELAIVGKQFIVKPIGSTVTVEVPKIKTIDREYIKGISTRALDDVDLAVVNNTYAGQVGLNAQDNGVFVEDKDSPYVNIIVSRTDNKDSKAIQDFVKAYHTEEVYQEAKKHFKDGVVKGWES